MKNVAATNGQSVSFAVLFFAMENTWEGIWAGTDMLLNFYSRPPWAKSVRAGLWNKTRNGRIQNLHCHATKKCPFAKIFLNSHGRPCALAPLRARVFL